MIAFRDFHRRFPVAVFLREARELVVENVGEALQKEQGK